MSQDDGVRIRHMVDAIEAALRFAKGRERADLEALPSLMKQLQTAPGRP